MTLDQAMQMALQHHQAGRLAEAEKLYRLVLSVDPQHANAWRLLGVLALDLGRADAAIELLGRALQCRADYVEAMSNLGDAFRRQGRLDEAVAMCRRAIELNPGFVAAYNNLGNALRESKRCIDALAAYDRALQLQPHYPNAHNNLANLLLHVGSIEQSVTTWRRAVTLQPDKPAVHSNLLYALLFLPGCDATTIAAEHRRWNDCHARPLRNQIRPHHNARSPDRPLRIGYVSPNLYDHVVGRNVLPLFARHDRRQFELFAYYNNPHTDALTRQFRAHVHGWRDTTDLSDEETAEQIRQDRIDILVDLALHMTSNRLAVFARKPAPVQVTFAGYPASTGLETIDYRFTDPYLDPPENDSFYSEKSIRLPHSFWCYDPLDCADIPLAPLPAQRNGFVTFGCLNTSAKINAGVLRLWAQVLNRIANSQLLLRGDNDACRRQACSALAKEGVDPKRIAFVGWQPRRQYLQSYDQIDIGLDSFPYNGHTTSLDSFWMGVPVVTLVGQTAVARAGFSQLSNLALSDLASDTPERFVEIAVQLAGNLPRLAELRTTLRSRMERSPLMDPAAFTRGIEEAYREMWRAWCKTDDVRPHRDLQHGNPGPP